MPCCNMGFHFHHNEQEHGCTEEHVIHGARCRKEVQFAGHGQDTEENRVVGESRESRPAATFAFV